MSNSKECRDIDSSVAVPEDSHLKNLPCSSNRDDAVQIRIKSELIPATKKSVIFDKPPKVKIGIVSKVPLPKDSYLKILPSSSNRDNAVQICKKSELIPAATVNTAAKRSVIFDKPPKERAVIVSKVPLSKGFYFKSLPSSSNKDDTGHRSMNSEKRSAEAVNTAAEKDANSDELSMENSNKKRVKFTDVTMYYFRRCQGTSTVPSEGGLALGMEMKHIQKKTFPFHDHAEEKTQAHRKLFNHETVLAKHKSSTSNSDHSEDTSGVSISDLEAGSFEILAPYSLKTRCAILLNSGVNKIDRSEIEECYDINRSRQFVGCNCKTFCLRRTCTCIQAGIKCQEAYSRYPCRCTRFNCRNTAGRHVVNASKIRAHVKTTLRRLRSEKNLEQQMLATNYSLSKLSLRDTSCSLSSASTKSSSYVPSPSSFSVASTSPLASKRRTVDKPLKEKVSVSMGVIEAKMKSAKKIYTTHKA